MGKMGTDLVRPARMQSHQYQAQSPFLRQYPVFRINGRKTLRRSIPNLHQVPGRLFPVVCLHPILLPGRRCCRDAQISLAQLTTADQLVYIP